MAVAISLGMTEKHNTASPTSPTSPTHFADTIPGPLSGPTTVKACPGSVAGFPSLKAPRLPTIGTLGAYDLLLASAVSLANHPFNQTTKKIGSL